MPVPKDINYAEFAHDTYKPVNSRRKKIYHMILNENQSDLYHSVYANPMTKEMHLSIRGTDPTHLPDLSADIAIARSKEMDNPRLWHLYKSLGISRTWNNTGITRCQFRGTRLLGQ